jgi:hypothetical protein
LASSLPGQDQHVLGHVRRLVRADDGDRQPMDRSAVPIHQLVEVRIVILCASRGVQSVDPFIVNDAARRRWCSD